MSRRSIGLLAILLLSVATTTVATQQRGDGFPHEEHDGLFPLCTGCHQPEEADRAARFPDPALCARCHDGEQEDRVEWSLRWKRPNNLTFEHGRHFDATADEDSPVECQTCHNQTLEPSMSVVDASGERCVDCHAHQAREHTLDAECSTCHLPLAETELSAARIGRLPEPTDHADAGFLSDLHGKRARSSVATCTVCHTRERCESCHVDASSEPAIRAMPEAPQIEWPAWETEYPAPPSHEAELFQRTHGDVTSAAECSTCHTRESCTACHAGPPNEVMAALPAQSDVRAPGVQPDRVAPLNHAAPDFAWDHGPWAAADGAACAQCHTVATCSDCHDAPAGPVYHPADFVFRHSTDAYGGRLECSNCHDTRVFCQECHQKSGFQAEGRLGPGFHTAEPLWLLRHGAAARRGLESCTTCHTQNNCLQCHSTVGAFQVSPHRSDFDARRAQEKNSAICRACHIGDPFRTLGGGSD